MSDTKQPIRPEESLAKMIASLKEKTGNSLEEWKAIIAKSTWLKHGEIVAGLKSIHGLTHGYAHQIALHAKKIDEPSTSDPIEELFVKRPDAKAVYDVLMPRIQAFGNDLDVAPKKGYLSLRRKKQFAVLQPAAGRLDVGIQLKGVEPGERLEASGNFNAMLTHRVRVVTPAEVDEQLTTWLHQAYEAAG